MSDMLIVDDCDGRLYLVYLDNEASIMATSESACNIRLEVEDGGMVKLSYETVVEVVKKYNEWNKR